VCRESPDPPSFRRQNPPAFTGFLPSSSRTSAARPVKGTFLFAFLGLPTNDVHITKPCGADGCQTRTCSNAWRQKVRYRAGRNAGINRDAGENPSRVAGARCRDIAFSSSWLDTTREQCSSPDCNRILGCWVRILPGLRDIEYTRRSTDQIPVGCGTMETRWKRLSTFRFAVAATKGEHISSDRAIGQLSKSRLHQFLINARDKRLFFKWLRNGAGKATRSPVIRNCFGLVGMLGFSPLLEKSQ
jgi:hypothetical protein